MSFNEMNTSFGRMKAEGKRLKTGNSSFIPHPSSFQPREVNYV